MLDAHATDWWPVDRIKNIPDEYEHAVTDPGIAAGASKFLFFADYAVWALAWAICCVPGANYGRIAVIPAKTASSPTASTRSSRATSKITAVYTDDCL